MSESKTPRTDDEIIRPHGCNGPEDHMVPAHFARQLEQELGDFKKLSEVALSDLQSAQSQLTTARGIVEDLKSCLNTIGTFSRHSALWQEMGCEKALTLATEYLEKTK